MRKSHLIAAVLAVAVMGYTGLAHAVIGTGESHDLRTGVAGDTTQICAYCHTPHNTVAGGPLWNRTAPAGPFTMYNSTFSTTIDNTVAATPEGVSAACLSCHDGVTAYNSVAVVPSDATNAGSMNTSVMTGAFVVGNVLTNDHPISIAYDPAVDTGLNTVDGTASVGGLPLYVGTSPLQVECGSCHDPHTLAPGKYLRASLVDSALCKTCHIK